LYLPGPLFPAVQGPRASSPLPVPDRGYGDNIVILDKLTQKIPDALRSISGNGTSETPNSNFVGSITVPAVNYMVYNLHIDEFKNTNILGDGDKWSSGISRNTLSLMPTAKWAS
jgi:hypothetical protein